MPTEIKEEKKKKCRAEQVIGLELLRMIKVNPQSAQFRASILRRLLKPIPDEANTYQKIVDWIEAEFEPPKVVSDSNGNPDMALQVNIDASDTDIGTCRYTRSRYGTANFRIPVATLISIAHDSSNRSEFVDLLNSYISDNLWNHFRVEEISDEETSNHSSEDGDDAEWNYAHNSDLNHLIAVSKAFIEQVDPELSRRLDS